MTKRNPIAVWVVMAGALCGCSGQSQTAADNDATPPAGNTASAINGPSAGQRADASTIRQTRLLEGSTQAAALFAQVEQLQAQQANVASREEFLRIGRSILKLSSKVLELNPEPRLRDQALHTWFETAIGITRLEGRQAAELLAPLDQLAERIITENPDPDLVADAHYYKILGHLYVESDLTEDDPSVYRRLLEQTRAFADVFAKNRRVSDLLFQIGQSAQWDGQYDTAAEAYQSCLDMDPESPDAEQLRYSLKQLDMLGKPFALVGPKLGGGEVNIADYKGKVVLVDFWATWCTPCLGELPNVWEVYERHHDQGFEVIGVSLDFAKETLQSFVEAKAIPWTQIHFEDNEAQRSFTQNYGVYGIPATFLVDRTGKLARITVRGPNLEPAVAELLGER